jgi:hypothetical protein
VCRLPWCRTARAIQALGAPNLTDKVWLHGWGEEAVMAMINGGKSNEMPAHEQAAHAPSRYTYSRLTSSNSATRPSECPLSAAGKTVSLYKKRQRIHPREVHGLFQRWRWFFVFLTQAVFYGLPWLQWTTELGQRQAVLFDLERASRFYIFGLVLYPQDFIYLTGLLIVSATRCSCSPRWPGGCGAATPARRRSTPRSSCGSSARSKATALQRMQARRWRPGARTSCWRKGGKHTDLGAASACGPASPSSATSRRSASWRPAASAGQLGPWETFWVLFYSLATYGNAGFLREQVCKYMCPYARFQSAMFDKRHADHQLRRRAWRAAWPARPQG